MVVCSQVVTHENINLLFFVNFSKILYFILDVPRLPSKLKNAVSWLTPPRTSSNVAANVSIISNPASSPRLDGYLEI